MDKDIAVQTFAEIKQYYDSIEQPKYRNAELKELQRRYGEMLGIKDWLESDPRYVRLLNAMSQILARLGRHEELTSAAAGGEGWSNLSERGMNKAIPPVYSIKGSDTHMEWTDRWGHSCYVSNGSWTAKNYRVMDVLGYMFLLREGGDRLPEDRSPIFYDLADIEVREVQLNKKAAGHNFTGDGQDDTDKVQQFQYRYSIGFTDSQFRKFSGLGLGSTEILTLLLETSRVEFKLSFPVRLKCSKDENRHRMNFFSRFFELSYQDLQVRKDGIVQERKYRVHFNTLLGELFVNNLKARFNDRIDLKFYTLSDSAQIFYRRMLLHHNFPTTELYLKTIAEAVGFRDQNLTNLIKTVESNILGPLKEQGYIESYKRNGGRKFEEIKYIITRKKAKDKQEGDVGSVKEG